MALTNTQYKFFADFIEKELGIVYPPQNYYQLEKRINDICKNLEFDSVEAFWKSVSVKGIHGHIRQLILDVATNNETSFFRDPRLFKAISEEIFPKWREANQGSNLLRVWSAASSFGQEPYTVAMLHDQFKKQNPSFPRVDIFASDISENALTRAKEGKYSQLEVQRGLPAPLLINYFQKKDDDFWHIKPEIKMNVRFGKVNLLELVGVIGKFDIILCRNVLIYQNQERKKKILENLKKFLNPGGILILGAAESLIGVTDQFEQEVLSGCVIYKPNEAKAA